MPRIRPHYALNQLRRYQRLLTFGGGALLTVIILVAYTSAAIVAVRANIVNARQIYLFGHGVVMREIVASETSFRAALFDTELLRTQDAPSDAKLVERFRASDGAMRLTPFAGPSPFYVFVTPHAQLSDNALGRNLTVIKFSRITATAALQHSRTMSGYYYAAQHDYAVLVPAPPLNDPKAAAVLADRDALVKSLTDGVDHLLNEQPHGTDPSRRTIRWTSPWLNPWTGENMVRIAGPLFSGKRAFGLIATTYDPNIFIERLAHLDADGQFMIVSQTGKLVAALPGKESDPSLIERLLRVDVARHPADRVQDAYSDGLFVFGSPLGDTGWRLVYAYSWLDCLAKVAPQLAISAAAALLMLIVVWSLIFVLTRRVFEPLLARSLRVFDSEGLSRTLIETAPIGLGLIAADTGRPILKSSAMTQTAERVMTDAPSLSAQFVRHYAQQGATNVLREDLALPTRDGGHIDLAMMLAPARYQDMSVLVAAFIDVTEKKQVEHALRDAKQAADEARLAADTANRAKSTFLSTMSHEIRTPLNAILGNLELLQRDEALARHARERLQVVMSSSVALLDIINDILDISKIEAGQMTVESIPFDLAATIRAVAAIFEPVAHAKGLQFDCIVDDAIAPCYVGDPTRVRQVAGNLLSNAIKFTETGDVLIEVYLRDDTAADSPIVIGVSDSGIGVSGEQLAHLFEPFVQADSMIARRYGGTGLGLALCRHIVELMGGTIDASSVPNDGSQFVVTLPFKAQATGVAKKNASAGAGTSDRDAPGRLRIIVVDDQPANRELIRMQLDTLGHQADTADSGSVALRLINERHYDLVMTDLNMPDMDGYTLARCLRAQRLTMPIVAVTARADVEEPQRCSAAGIERVLVKPVLLDALDQTLRTLTYVNPAPLQSGVRRSDIAQGPLPENVHKALNETSQTLVVTLRKSIDNHDRDAVLKSLHELLGTFAMIHEREAANACAQMEQQAQSHDLAAVLIALDRFEPLARSVLARRGPRLGTIETTSGGRSDTSVV
jgi:two-component system capsular synthesis sensor histidine kinase RcsC